MHCGPEINGNSTLVSIRNFVAFERYFVWLRRPEPYSGFSNLERGLTYKETRTGSGRMSRYSTNVQIYSLGSPTAVLCVTVEFWDNCYYIHTAVLLPRGNKICQMQNRLESSAR
jgi:hypothetical protein